MNRKIKLLIVEDEISILTGLVDLFTYHGYEVHSASDGKEGLAMALTGQFDLLLLDVMLPTMDGFSICNTVRQKDRKQPIIMLTAKTGDDDIIKGLTLGADDYVAKPFSVTQLVLRVKAVLRRSSVEQERENHLSLGENLEIDRVNLKGTKEGKVLDFTRREVDILDYLRENGDRPVSREELLVKVWGYGKELEIETRTVDIHIAKLRKKIEEDPKEPRLLLTVRGEGYRLQKE